MIETSHRKGRQGRKGKGKSKKTFEEKTPIGGCSSKVKN
jgi:hypothetical protein